jgi:hypothetical protein
VRHPLPSPSHLPPPQSLSFRSRGVPWFPTGTFDVCLSDHRELSTTSAVLATHALETPRYRFLCNVSIVAAHALEAPRPWFRCWVCSRWLWLDPRLKKLFLFGNVVSVKNVSGRISGWCTRAAGFTCLTGQIEVVCGDGCGYCRLPSTTHRVAPPRDPALKAQCRTSFPLAIYVDEHELLSCLPSCGKPKYSPESAIDFHTAITSKYYGLHYRRDNGED